MVSYLTKFDASEGYNKVTDFLNGSYIKYALTMNPNIYVSCIKQFWNTVTIKQDNDVTRMQSLVDKKKVMVTEAAIRDVLWLDDAEGVDYLPNEEIFAKLARMGYEKPSTKLTFYKAFLSSQWKVGKRFFGVETPLFEGMLVGQEIEEGGDAEEHVQDVTAGDAAQGDDTAAHGEAQHTLPQSPRVQLQPKPQHQPQQATDFPMSLLQEALNVCAALTRRVEHLKIDTSDDTVMDNESNQGRIKDEMDKDDVVALMDDKEEDKKDEKAKEDEPTEVQEVVDVTTAKLIIKVVTATSETVTDASTILFTAEPQVPTSTITAAPAKVDASPSKRRKGVVIMDPKEESTTSSIIPADTKSKDKGKGVMVEEPKPLKKKQQIKMDEEYQESCMLSLTKILTGILDYFKGMSYDDIRPIFEAKFNSNVDFLLKTKKHMEEEESRVLQRINETPAERAAKRRKLDKEVEDLKRHLEIVADEDDDVYTEATPLARKVPVVDYEIIEINNKPY
nr:hypothetical protein [Tanacetum cinerariifolium]